MKKLITFSIISLINLNISFALGFTVTLNNNMDAYDADKPAGFIIDVKLGAQKTLQRINVPFKQKIDLNLDESKLPIYFVGINTPTGKSSDVEHDYIVKGCYRNIQTQGTYELRIDGFYLGPSSGYAINNLSCWSNWNN